MVFPEHWLLAWGGSATGGEEWSGTLRFMKENVNADPLNIEGALDDLEADITTFILNTVFPICCSLEWLKFNKIGPDGRYVSESESNTRVIVPPVVGTTGVRHPHQTALVITWLTDAARGYGHAGRLYYPGQGFDVTNDTVLGPVISDAQRDIMGNAAAQLIADLGNWPGLDLTDLRPGVISSRGGVARPITGVRVGRRLDVQRRRAKSQAEAYEDVPVP